MYSFWDAVVYIVGFGCATGIITSIISHNSKFRQKKLIEASKTNNLALICQMLNNRPDISLEDLSKYIELDENKHSWNKVD